MPEKHLTMLEFLQSFRRGELLNEADDAMRELVSAVEHTGGSGSLTVKFALKLNKAGQVEIQPTVKMEKPRPSLGIGIYYANGDGGLVRSDPRQMDFEDELARRRDSNGNSN